LLPCDSLEDFCNDHLKTLNTRLVVRTSKDNEDERPYYVALVKTPHRKLQKTEQVSGETYTKGTFVVEITWCQLDSRTASGTRHYIKLDWHQTLCANQISRAGTKILAKPSALPYTNQRYVMSRDTHERLLQYGDITVH
jgi:hypothetical protein